MGNMYNEAAFAKLDQVMKCADDHGLMVTLRIGYCWDYSGEASLPERYAGVVQDGSNDRKMWIDYCKTIYDRVSDYGNFQGGFITWGGLLGLYVKHGPGSHKSPQYPSGIQMRISGLPEGPLLPCGGRRGLRKDIPGLFRDLDPRESARRRSCFEFYDSF